MRVKRVRKYKKNRHRRIRNFVFYVVILPSVSIFIGYLITSLFILPAIVRVPIK